MPSYGMDAGKEGKENVVLRKMRGDASSSQLLECFTPKARLEWIGDRSKDPALSRDYTLRLSVESVSFVLVGHFFEVGMYSLINQC